MFTVLISSDHVMSAYSLLLQLIRPVLVVQCTLSCIYVCLLCDLCLTFVLFHDFILSFIIFFYLPCFDYCRVLINACDCFTGLPMPLCMC